MPDLDSTLRLDVWIVEDDSRYTDTVCLALDGAEGVQCGRQFETVFDLIEAIETDSMPDVLLLDVHLPGLSGLDALPMLRRRLPATPVVMLTISDNADLIFRAFRAGASGYLTKDANLDQVLAAVREAARGGTLMPAFVASKVLDFLLHEPAPDQNDLSGREKDVLALMADGLTKEAIASRVDVSRHTVDYHIRSIYGKLHVQSGVQAVARAIRRGLI